METIEPSLIFNRPVGHQDSLCLAWVFLCATIFFLVLRLLVLEWSLSTGMWTQTHEAHKCRFYMHMDVGTGGTEVWVLQALPEGSTGDMELWVLQARREPRDRPVSREAC